MIVTSAKGDICVEGVPCFNPLSIGAVIVTQLARILILVGIVCFNPLSIGAVIVTGLYLNNLLAR